MSKRGWAIRYSFRAVMVFMAAVCVLLAVVSHHHRAEKSLAAELENSYAFVHTTWAAPRWSTFLKVDLRNTVIGRVESLTIIDNTIGSADVESIVRQFGSLKEVFVLSDAVTKEGEKSLEKKFPGVYFSNLTSEAWDDPGAILESVEVACPLYVDDSKDSNVDDSKDSNVDNRAGVDVKDVADQEKLRVLFTVNADLSAPAQPAQ